tara:strand:+ start:32 stop:556 length:525 start_codon:yes stop_codon:yes gene_type:complete
MESNSLQAVVKIVGVHGLKGALKAKIFLENPEDILLYTLYEESGVPIGRVKKYQEQAKTSSLIFPEIHDRTQAETWIHKTLYMRVEDLPSLPQEIYYHQDLVGCKVVDRNNNLIATVQNLHNFGTEDLLELLVHATGTHVYAPFRQEIFLEIKVQEHLLIVDKEALDPFIELNT